MMMAQNSRISDVFDNDRAALMPYFTIGYPNYDLSLDVIEACVEAGADLMELGIPFSDPLADGPTIQHSTQVALKNGVNVARCLDAVETLRQRGVEIPLILMGYINPIIAYGVEKFVVKAAEVGVNGFIIPDLPPDEAVEMETYCQQQGLDMVYLLPPNSTDDRIRSVSEHSSGFVYLVSVTGITGARDTLPLTLTEFVQRMRAATKKSLAVGFGISTPEQTAAVGQIADGVIVGSALVKAVSQAENPVDTARDFVMSLKSALSSVTLTH
jgi:tryptophan synthase alpha chain